MFLDILIEQILISISDNLRCNGFKECLQVDKNLYVETNKRLGCHRLNKFKELVDKRSEIGGKKANIAEKKMLSERSLLLSGYSINNTIESVKPNCEKGNEPSLPTDSSPAQATGLTITPTAAAAAYLYLEKVKHERMSPRVATARIDSLKDAIMESSGAAAVAAAMVNNNTIINNSNNSNDNLMYNQNNKKDNVNNSNSNTISGETITNCSNSCSNISSLVNSQDKSSTENNRAINTTSDDIQCHSPNQSTTNHTQQQQHQIHKHQHRSQQQQSLHMSNSNVKKERLSPGTNGDLQTSVSR